MRIGWKKTAAIATAFTLGIAGGVTMARTARPAYVIVPTGEAKFAPLDPKNPGGIQMAVLSGDPRTGPVAFFVKLPRGPVPLHWHTSDYYAFTVEGTTKHWLPGKEAEARANPPGTFWFQPGGAPGAHGDECVSDSCIVFIQMAGKFDFNPAAAPKK